MYREQNKTIVLRYYEELFERRRLAVVDEIFASGYVSHHGTDEVRGLEDFKKSVAEFFSAFPDHHTAVDDIIAEGDRVVTRWTTRGTHQGHLFGIAPTNKRVAFS
jgi:predicted ester cyclase